MCGIIGYVGFNDPKGILLDGLKRLEYRGYDSAGIAILEEGRMQVYRSEGRLHRLEEKLATKHFQGRIGVGHTRWATHGAPTEVNAHPHRVGAITLVHNGIIENYLEHKENLLKLGRSISSDTDTEIVAHLFDIEVAAGRTLHQAVLNVLPKLKGSYAFVILNDHEPDVIVGVRNGAPLLLGVGKDESFIASDVQAILSRTNQIIYLNEGEFAVCRKSGIDVMDAKGKKLNPPIKTIQWTPEQMEKAGYRHYMLKEIHEQSRALTNTIESHIDHAQGIVSLQGIDSAKKTLKDVKRVSIVACGTARHAGLIGKDYIERFAHIPVDVDFGSEFRYRDPILEKGTLLLVISQSGETADTLAGLREGKSRGVTTLAICNVRESTIAREADHVLYTNAGPEIGVASTKAFTTQLAMLLMLSIEMGYVNGSLPSAGAKDLTTDLLRLPIFVDKTLALEPEIEKIALENEGHTFFFYMGRGNHYPIALEGALKLKEISYLHAEGYPAGELKHGPIALIDRNTVVIVLAPKDRDNKFDPGGRSTELSQTLNEKSMSNLQEVKSRGGRIWCVAGETEKGGPFEKESHFFTAIPNGTWSLNPILLSIPMQLFAYHVALQRGTDVDKPRNLAKSVTVE